MNILLATIIGLSFSVRTPNVQPNPMDYEFAVRASKEAGKFQYFVKRDWERELGEEYIDTQFDITESVGHWYVGVKYVDKQSKFYNYSQARFGLHTKILQAGLAFSDDGTMVNMKFHKILKEKTLECKINIDFSTNLVTEIWELKSEARKYITKHTHIYASFNKEFFNGHVDEQYKVGLGIKF